MSFYSSQPDGDPMAPAGNAPQGVAFESCERCGYPATVVHRWQGHRRDGQVKNHNHPFVPQIPIKGPEPFHDYLPEWLYWELTLFKCTGNCSMGWYRYQFHPPQHESSVPIYSPVQEASQQQAYNSGNNNNNNNSNNVLSGFGFFVNGQNAPMSFNAPGQPFHQHQQQQQQQQAVTYASVASGKTPPPPSGTMSGLLPPPSMSPKSKLSLSNASLAVRTVTSKTSERTEVTESSTTLMSSGTDYASWTALGSSRGGNISRDESMAQRVTALSSDDTSAQNACEQVISVGDGDTTSLLSSQTPRSQRIGGNFMNVNTPTGSSVESASVATPEDSGHDSNHPFPIATTAAGSATAPSYAMAVTSTPRTPVGSLARDASVSAYPTPPAAASRTDRFNSDEQRRQNYRDKRIMGVCQECAVKKCRCPAEHDDRPRAEKLEKRVRNRSHTSAGSNQKNVGKKMRGVRSIGSGK